MVTRVGNIELVALGVVGHRLRAEKLALAGSAVTKLVHECAIGAEGLDAIVAAVLGDEHAAIRQERDVGRVDELTPALAVAAEHPKELATGRVADDPMFMGVGDHERPIGRDGGADGLAAIGLGQPPLGDNLARR